VSSNVEAERKLLFMFRHVPVRIFKLKNSDFFSSDEGLYPTMGVDRVAVLYGAKLTYGCPVLTIDGGTAMTYAALDKNGTIVGGGISPGAKVRLQSLHEHTGALPNIDHRSFKAAVELAMKNKTPLPVFAKNTEVSMMTTLCSELACQLRNIISQFVAMVNRDDAPTTSTTDPANTNGNHKPTPQEVYVVITGGDGELFQHLLAEDASGIVPWESEPIPAAVKIRYNKHAAHYGIGYVLYRKCLERLENPGEELRRRIQGLRVAVKSKREESGFSRGTVLTVELDPPPADPLDVSHYSFLIRHDTSAKQQMLSLKVFYGKMKWNRIDEVLNGWK